MTSSERAVLLRYHEIALKGGNRKWFEDRLAQNARKLIARELEAEAPSEKIRITKQYGRIVIHTPWNDNVRAALNRAFGLSSFSPMRIVPTDYETLKKAAVEEVRIFIEKNGLPKGFRVTSRRTDKVFPEVSTQIDRIIGTAIHEAFPDLKLDLEDPEFVVGVEIRFENSYLWTEKVKGPGGLPVGSNGKLLSLMSGGLDSPVAAIQVLRRGSATGFLHFYGTPFVGPEALQKVEDLVRIVNRYQPDPQPLHVVPFGKIQEKIALVTDPKMRTVLYRRMMVRIACALAPQIRAQAIVTGESLGQVASQTVENLVTINSVATLPILRPLVAYDKDEIIEQAHHWGTFDISIRPGADCCTLFADRHPSLRSNPELAEKQEARFSVSDLVQEALNGIEVIQPS